MLPSWSILSTAAKRMPSCSRGDIVLLHASGRARAADGDLGIYAAYVVTHEPVRCELCPSQMQTYSAAFRQMRARCQWRVAVRFLTLLDITRATCADFAHHLTPHLLGETVEACPAAVCAAVQAAVQAAVAASAAATAHMDTAPTD